MRHVKVMEQRIGKNGEVHGVEKLRVAGHELRSLADERTAEAVGMERQRLVAQAIEGHGGQVVVHGDLQLPQRVVLKLAAGLARQVDADERRDVRTEHVEYGLGATGSALMRSTMRLIT